MSLAFRRLVAHVALLAFAGVIALLAIDGHSSFDDDRACGEIGLHVSAEAALFSIPVPVDPPQHCALCHLQRAASGASPVVQVTTSVVLAPTSARPVEGVTHERRGVPTAGSSRAPPASFSV